MRATFPHVALSTLPVVDLLDLVGSGECRYDPELHNAPDVFEAEPVMERLARVDVAKELCEACPVWDACLEYALRTEPTSGIWAGYSHRELAELRRSVRSTALDQAA
ncbi:WhiB family transcriptional regulator [Actinomadura roseirufa]|uniref:WhiB family transcriptional regulator n=1 Tax=Actinomadura roseirufa TaxID=2094049 RepID=UPI0010412C66|nr:WhiB family transcriptional regulator [Actinomadura roseirufa]